MNSANVTNPCESNGRSDKLSFREKILFALERFFPVVESAVAVAGNESEFEYAKASGSYAEHCEEVGGIEDKVVLDFGCGWGGETVWLAERCKTAMGCDINQSAVEDARVFSQKMGIRNIDFRVSTARELPFDDNTFDAIFSTNVFEHVMEVETMLKEIKRILKPGGHFVTQFGPLFYSPLGYHLCWATQVSWAHLIFGFKPVIEVRNTKREPICPKDWEQTGLGNCVIAIFAKRWLMLS